MFGKFSLGQVPGLPQLTGTASFGCVAVDDRIVYRSFGADRKKTHVFGKIDYSVDAKGAFKGEFVEENGGKHELSGQFDVLGNLTGHATWGGRHYSLAAKIPQPGPYQSLKRLDERGVLQLIGEDGYRVTLVGMVK